MGLSTSALRVLSLVIPPSQQFANASDLLRETGLTNEALSDAVDELEERGAVKPLRGGEHDMPGVTLRFSAIQTTVDGRRLYRECAMDGDKNGTGNREVKTLDKLVFISHKETDELIADLLVDYIQTATGLSDGQILCSSVTGHKLTFGTTIAQQLRDGVHTSVVLVALLTPDCLDRSKWVLFELGAAWGMRKLIVPVLGPGLSSQDLPGPLSDSRAIKIDGNHAATDLTAAINEICVSLSIQVNTSEKVQSKQQKFVEAYRLWKSAHSTANP